MPTISPLSGMAEPPVSVMFAVTSSWLIPLAVAIRSLCVHSDPRRNYELHIVHHGLEEEQMKELGKAVSSYPRVSLGFCRLPERLLEAHPDSFPYVDQDIINIVFHGRIAPLPLRWNYHFQFELHHAGMADLISGTEFEEAPALFESRSWKLFHLVGDYKPWLPPDMEKIYHRLYLALWWPLARQTPAFRRELRALYRQFTRAFRSRLRHHQWSLPVSPGRNFRKRREKIKTLQRQLAVFDGSWP